ncbi:diguanylate cyclase [Caenimonas koreensis DSM 17982]|uniref:Diguanylate cyclase n=1 Tax=Caenimonas koreensis DSM 17982 TaxID=1121255 RepID=A0A844B7U4_9BURK|nr:7TM diverse intracellular signaling domain-containing protein [Caenimonas koreensis]MRD47577.1 diguanylate cyclase [Caenimonas koreensis DSM 17982]
MNYKAASLWRSACALLLGFALMVLAVQTASARSVLELDVARQPVQMLDWGDAWMDESGSALVDFVASSDKIVWEPTHDHAIYPLTTGKALWIRFTIPPAPDAERWYLEIPYSAVNRVTLYTPDSIGKWLPQTAGDLIAVADWPVPHRHPLMPLVVSAEEPRKFLLRVENPHSFSAPLSFVSESYLSRHEQQTSLILGIYFGLAGLAVAVALLSAISLRDRAYAFYALSVALMAFSQAALTGIGGLHLWPHWRGWNDVSSMVFPVLTVGSLIWFFSEVVSITERSPRLHRMLVVLALSSLPVAALVGLIEPSLRFRIMVPYIVFTTTVAVVVVVWAARRGDRYGLWLLGGMAPVIIGACFPMARLLGLIPISFWTMHGMQVGIAIELPVLLVILMLRSQQRREHHRRMQGLDRIDPATGLINSYVFRERLARMMHRCERLKYQSAVLMIDIVNSEQIRRDFGQRAADELPLLVAGRLLSSAREIDSVARLGDLRFGLLMEGPMNEEEAASAGPRVVARCLMPFKNKPIECVARVRIGLTVVPTERADADGVIQRLEALLAAVPPESKRAVFTLRS